MLQESLSPQADCRANRAVYVRDPEPCSDASCKHPRKTSGIWPIILSAVSPGPPRTPISPCSHAAMLAASNAGTPCATNPQISPVSTSPDPAVASQGDAWRFTNARPSGAARPAKQLCTSVLMPRRATRQGEKLPQILKMRLADVRKVLGPWAANGTCIP